MQSNTLNKKFIIDKVRQILHNNKQDQTTVQVAQLIINDCLVYLIQLNTISSTMLLSENWPKQTFQNREKPILFAFSAKSQRQGRGQKQNSWQSPQGNMYLTLLFKLPFAYFPYLPLISIDSVFNTIKFYLNKSNSKAISKVKWINDILIDFQKVSGVLIKNELLGQNLFTQIGIGINVKSAPNNIQSIKQSVTYLQKHIEQNIDLIEMRVRLIETFVNKLYTQDLNSTIISSKANYENNLAYLNKQVVIYDYKYEQILGEGQFFGINQYGNALLKNHQNPYTQGRMKAQQQVL